jgi:hypothetical protein
MPSSNDVRLAILFTLSGIVSLAGCTPASDNPRTFKVSGTVTEKGKGLEGVSIVFVPSGNGGQAAFATTDASGKYDLMTFVPKDGAVPGTYKVKASKFDKPPASTQVFKDSEEEQKYYQENPKAAQPAKNHLPAKYANEQTSGLTHVVADKPSTFDIEIK